MSLVLLAIPWAGYQYVKEMEGFLRDGQEEALLATARAVARVLHEQPELFRYQGGLLRTAHSNVHLYVRPLRSPIQLDGYVDDWRPYRDRAQRFGADSVLESSAGYRRESLSFNLLTGTYAGYLYAVFEVTDDHVTYRAPDSLRLDRGDHLRIALQDNDGEFRRYFLSTSEPGWVNAHRMPKNPDDLLPGEPEVRIKGEWQETRDGYTLELRIPLQLIGPRLGFAIGDVDDPRRRTLTSLVGTTGTRTVEELGTIMVRSPTISRLLQGLERSAGRIWVLDRNRRVLALTGSLETRVADEQEPDTRSAWSAVTQGLYRLILKQPTGEFRDELSSASRLEGPEIESALEGAAATQWRPGPARQLAILAAAHPIWSEGEVLGAVVAEQTSNSILILQNRAMERLISTSLVVFAVAGVGLLAFATRLSTRVRRLRDQAEAAIGADGRPRGTLAPSGARDEIGDLSRSFADILRRLEQYTQYLETMAGKLSHELRTPLTVVRSSLDNLDESESSKQILVYSQRAREGLARLDGILNRMSEATRLEQSLQQAEQERFDVVRVVSSCMEGYRMAHPDIMFDLDAPSSPLRMRGVPDLIAQMFDKLVGNAIEFHSPDTPILVEITTNRTRVQLSVLNQGPALPESMQNSLFDSMVSVRKNAHSGAHLGLGLYIARLIAEFHGGRISARNRTDETGVEFTVDLPLGNA